MHSILYFHPYKFWKKVVSRIDKSSGLQIIVPLVISLVLLGVSILLTYNTIIYINTFLPQGKQIVPVFILSNLLLGTTIYLKTAVDFAILMANYMYKYPGWRNRIAIELGTTAGNTLGTVVIIVIWGLLHQFAPILGLLIFYSGLVLLRLAYETIEGLDNVQFDFSAKYPLVELFIDMFLLPLNLLLRMSLALIRITWHIIERIGIDRLIPRLHISASEDETARKVTFWGLFALNFMVPFALGLDDFAGYMALLSVTNVLSFATGVYLGHLVLNFFLFLYPQKTVRVMKSSIISWLGAAVLYVIALISMRESMGILLDIFVEHHLLMDLLRRGYYAVSSLSLQFIIAMSAIIVAGSNLISCKRRS